MPNQHYTTGEHWRAARRDGREEHHEYPQKTSRAAPTEKGGQRWSNNRADQGKVIDGPAREQTGCHTRTRRNNGDHTEAFTATLAHRRRLRIHTLPVKTKGAQCSNTNPRLDAKPPDLRTGATPAQSRALTGRKGVDLARGKRRDPLPYTALKVDFSTRLRRPDLVVTPNSAEDLQIYA
ncbi:hypothetical protein Bca4012_004765 [Brassica carinata]|uniref:Uncharacterized protein n=1 Tax=Brassica carinata TaxID=52824 RepID=A0A8X7RU70_BRACI|nr:hypothetical protein Bca52824_040801 [Brassica carinata]